MMNTTVAEKIQIYLFLPNHSSLPGLAKRVSEGGACLNAEDKTKCCTSIGGDTVSLCEVLCVVYLVSP